MSISEKHLGTALVTGASTGIGATYADRLAKRGYNLILVARDKNRLEALASRLRSDAGVKVEVLAADLTDRSDLGRVEERLKTDPTITLLVNNAGFAGSRSFLDADVDRLDAMIQLNVVAVVRLTAAVTPQFVERGSGAVINIGSVMGVAHELLNANYGATKAFVNHFSRGLSLELAEKGVRIQAVLPGATRTEIWERAGIDEATIPDAMFMTVDEMVDAALAGFDQGEVVTIPSLPSLADWEAFDSARQALLPNLSRNKAADRYHLVTA